MEINISDQMVKKILSQLNIPALGNPNARREQLKKNLGNLSLNGKLYFLRVNMNLTQTELGEKFSVDFSSISRMERGVQNIPPAVEAFIKENLVP
jgi:DNA-binding XRE family transcriptional regulator